MILAELAGPGSFVTIGVEGYLSDVQAKIVERRGGRWCLLAEKQARGQRKGSRFVTSQEVHHLCNVDVAQRSPTGVGKRQLG